MRIVKEAEERREEILDAAEKLFAAKGFDNTSTGDILDAVGIARGTLYYHFKSKEDILDGVIQRVTERLMQDAGRIVRKRELPVLERLIKAIMSLNVESKIGYEIMEQVHRPQNALILVSSVMTCLMGAFQVLAEPMILAFQTAPHWESARPSAPAGCWCPACFWVFGASARAM